MGRRRRRRKRRPKSHLQSRWKKISSLNQRLRNQWRPLPSLPHHHPRPRMKMISLLMLGNMISAGELLVMMIRMKIWTM
jgi:hypothetical protein